MIRTTRVRQTATVILMMCLFTGCNGVIDYPANCDGSSLILDLSSFPEGATRGSVTAPYPEGTILSAGTNTATRTWSFTHAILPFSTERRAKSEYEEDLRNPVFTSAPAEGGWGTPASLVSEFSGADEAVVGCGQEGSLYMCRGIARYHGYFVRIIAIPDSMDFTEAELNRILGELESRILTCVAQLEDEPR